MTNTSLKKWNKESLYSFTSLVITAIIHFNMEYLLDMVDTSNVFVKKFDEIILKLTQHRWWFASLDISFWSVVVIYLIFLILTLYFGIKSIQKTSTGKEKGRMLGVISAILSSVFLIAFILVTIFNL